MVSGRELGSEIIEVLDRGITHLMARVYVANCDMYFLV
jgi:hypothetical protein